MYRIIKGDATLPKLINPNKTPVIAHVCNNEGGWGAGFVLALSNRYPQAEDRYRSVEKRELGDIQFVVLDNIVIVNMIAQTLDKTPEGMIPLRYGALAICMHQFFDAVEPNTHEIHAPMFGSGLAGGHWPTIEQLIKEVWVEDLGFDVTVYEFAL